VDDDRPGDACDAERRNHGRDRAGMGAGGAKVTSATSIVLGSGLTAWSALTGTLTYATFAPRSKIWGKLHWRGSRASAPRIALTFDDGPTPPYTDRVLHILGELNIRATFF